MSGRSPGGAGEDRRGEAGRGFELVDAERVHHGQLLDVCIAHYRHADGGLVSREIVRRAGAVGIVAHDEELVWLVRQPREAVGESGLLEIPAGRLDVEGEEPAAAAQRELAEEIGRGARRWEPILSYFSSAGFTDEQVHLFCATDLHEQSAESAENERIEIVGWPLGRLEQAIEECRDAKTLIGLMWLRRRLNA